MKLIVGLGNPGKKYEQTRHNIGFIVLDEFAKNQNLKFPKESDRFGYVIKNTETTLLKPNTFMNLSGEAIGRLANYYKIEPIDIIIVHDDTDIAFNNMKINKGKSPAGHKGVISTIEHLGTNEFWRLRIGTGGEKLLELKKHNNDIDAFVLGRFDTDEKKQLPSIIERTLDAIKDCINLGPETAAQKYNQKS